MARQPLDVDELYEVKNAFYVGNYQQAIIEAQNVHPSSPLIALQRDTFLYRSYIAQGNYRIVMQELRNADPLLQPLMSLVEYSTKGSHKSDVVADIDARVAKGIELANEVFLIVASIIYYQEENYEAALKILHGAQALELRAFALQCLLAMNRTDLGHKQLKAMQDADDDATLTQLAQAWLNLIQGGPGVQDTHYSIIELADRLCMLGAGPAALGVASAAARGMWEEAEKMLTEAQSHSSQQPELLLALAVSAVHANKHPEVSSRYLAQLLDSYPEHRFTKEYNAKSNEFKRLCDQYQPSVVS